MQPYIYVCEIGGNCNNPATKHDVEDFNYLCEEHYEQVVKGIL